MAKIADKHAHYCITAIDEAGKKRVCFTWLGLPKTGIARARRESKQFKKSWTKFQAELLNI